MESAERVVLALGSNMGDRLRHLQNAVRALSVDITLDRASAIYETHPVGSIDQPDFLNAVVTGTTSLTPEALLECARRAEASAGRERLEVDGPRTLDVDILFFGDRIIKTPILTIPHPRWAERAFVRIPLSDLDLEQPDPVTGRPIRDLCRATPPMGVRRFGPPSSLGNGL